MGQKGRREHREGKMRRSISPEGKKNKYFYFKMKIEEREKKNLKIAQTSPARFLRAAV